MGKGWGVLCVAKVAPVLTDIYMWNAHVCLNRLTRKQVHPKTRLHAPLPAPCAHERAHLHLRGLPWLARARVRTYGCLHTRLLVHAYPHTPALAF